jgi:hypothetical protein
LDCPLFCSLGPWHHRPLCLVLTRERDNRALVRHGISGFFLDFEVVDSLWPMSGNKSLCRQHGCWWWGFMAAQWAVSSEQWEEKERGESLLCLSFP